jgi:hypothetical protein
MNEQDLKGMNVNERLLAMGLFAEWDAAAKARDGEALRTLLRKVYFTEQQANQTVEALLANPKRYGF